MRGVLDQQVTYQHEVLRNTPTRLRRQGGRQRIRLEPLVEVVLPQKRLENVFLFIDLLLRNHGLPSLFLFLLLVPIDPHGLTSALTVLSILLSVAPAILRAPSCALLCLFILDAEYAHHFVQLGFAFVALFGPIHL